MRFGIFIYDGVEPIDLATFGVLSMARRIVPEIEICSIGPRAGSIALASGLKVTAEGVEDAAALSALIGMGCDLAQGYFIAHPVPLNELLTFLANNSVEQLLARPAKHARRA